MTTRRRLLLFGMLAVVVGLAVSSLIWPETAGITETKAARIKNGMTLAEIEAILGGPARDEITGQPTGTAAGRNG